MSRELRQRRSELAVNVGLAVNVVLAAVKTSVGVLGRSPALLADGINSTSDVVYYIVVKVFTRLAGAPPDQEHPYGHRQLETIAALVVGAFVVTTGVAIFWDAVNTSYELATSVVEGEGAAGPALWVALATVLIKIALTVWTRGIGRSTGNPAVLALAADHRNDIAAAGAAALGIFLGQMGHAWVDPAAGGLVALFVFYTGFEILRDSSRDLMHVVDGGALSTRIGELVRGVSGVVDLEELSAHRFGPYLLVTLTIGVDGEISVSDAHGIASEVERRLEHELELVRKVHVHIHPATAESSRG